jgi:hypothetical protein
MPVPASYCLFDSAILYFLRYVMDLFSFGKPEDNSIWEAEEYTGGQY